jgi:DNA integrity scanning protein DisA with diadenylate cyclase activity
MAEPDRRVPPGRLRRLREELIEEGIGVIETASDPDAVLEELEYAMHPPPHERRVPAYGSIVTPTVAPHRWAEVTGVGTELDVTTDRDDHDVRRYADGLVSWTVRKQGGVDALVVFDRATGSERDLVVVAAATGGIIVQRRQDGAVRIVGPFGVARWDSANWHVEPPLGSWLARASCGLSEATNDTLEHLVRFAVHDLGALGIGALFVFAGRSAGATEARLATPPPLRVDRPTDLGPLRHVLAQVDGAAFIDEGGVLRALGVRLVPSREAEDAVAPSGGTRHISARRYSYDDPDAVVVAVSEDGPVSVFRAGTIIGRSPDD